MPTLYVSDLDGTLLDAQAQLPEATREAVEDFIARGGLFTFATARSWHSLRVVTGGYLPELPLICYNGAFLVEAKSGKPLYVESFGQAQTRTVCRAVEQLPATPLWYALVEGRERVSYDPTCLNEGLRDYLNKRRQDRRMYPVGAGESLTRGEVYYCTCIGTQEELMPAWEALRGESDLHVTFQKEIYRDEYWLEIMPAHATKAHAVQRLQKALGCERLVTFGDAINDLPMFAVSDEAYAVANAVPALKAAATAILPSNEEGGVAQFLRERRL